ncbi:MAG TPA: hypothetical protein VGO56_11225 [Pyrinomonadaceae bacterium]|jgi:hypothetical protein|nr:hypothetical protein [Pyrinomonadaceae bacterium]
MPVVWNDDKVWFDESLKLAQICHDVAALQTSNHNVLLLSHFEATLSQLAASLNAKGIRYERFASLNPTDLCRHSSAGVWLGSARAFRVTQDLTPGSASAFLEVLVAEHHPLQSEDQEIADAAQKLSCNSHLCFYFSLDDPLMQYFGNESIKALFERLGIDKSECISHHLINSAIRAAQEKIERKVGKGVPTYSVEDWFKYNLPGKRP